MPKSISTTLRSLWSGMRRRCNNPLSNYYHIYGGRGIYVDAAWDTSDAFVEWALANGYAKGLQIDRIDNDGPYAPWNCRWVTPRENSNNTRMTVFSGGVPASYVAEKSGISRQTVLQRIRRGCSPEDVSSEKRLNSKTRIVSAFGEEKSLIEWSKDSRCVVTYHSLFYRLKNGMPPEDAITVAKQKPGGGEKRIVLAFGEEKTIADWSRDERCVVLYRVLVQRLIKNWPAEDAITKPRRVQR